MSRFVLAASLIIPLFNNLVLAEEDGVKAAYQNWRGSFKDLIETFVIVERSEEDLKHAKWESLFIFKREKGTELIEISVVPKAVNVRYVDVYYPYSFGPDSTDNIWRYVDVALERDIKVRIPFQAKNDDGDKDDVFLRKVVETRVSVAIPWNAAFTDEQLDIFMNALRKREPLKLKGRLSLYYGGNDLGEIGKRLTEWGLEFIPDEVNGTLVSGFRL